MKNGHAVLVVILLAFFTGCFRFPYSPAGLEEEALRQQSPTPLPVPDRPQAEDGGAVSGRTQEEAPKTPNVSTKKAPGIAAPQPPALEQALVPSLAIAEEMVRLMNDERAKKGLAPLQVHADLSAAALWVATENLQEKEVSTEDIRSRLHGTVFAATTFALNRVWSTGPHTNHFADRFAEQRRGDIVNSESLRKNILDPGFTHIGIALAGGPDGENGTAGYKLVMAWVFAPLPAPAGYTDYGQVARENVDILNGERRQRGLGELATHPVLTDLAREKAIDLLRYDYFAHDSPRLGKPHDMITARVMPLPRMTAENLWKLEGTFHSAFLDGAAGKAHAGLMDSEGHRKNLLNPDFTHVGMACVGAVADRGDTKLYQIVLVQLFIKE